jgi:transcriptional regulator with GAF, ATPase, and Fis domain
LADASPVLEPVETTGSRTFHAARRAFESRLVSAVLARQGGRQAAAARELGLSRQGLAKAMKRLGLERRAAVSAPVRVRFNS